ncbi:MAG: SusC/RagA family TonB-linked outer membrane protein [Prolixibacteraceae bacterium]|nr:SusC/RagA family TonB-linked outer membrane protein [Prolixibacteraceae bacterium]
MAQISVSGTVVSEADGLGLPGVSVSEKGTMNGTLTDTDGKYTIKVSSGNSVLVFSFIGMKTIEETVKTNAVIDVKMISQDISLNEVVVTALGVSREKKSLGYAVSEVSGENLNTVKELNVVNSLAGRVAGVVITQGTFGPGSSSRVVIRGNNSLTGNNQPLYVIDGIPIDNSGYGSASSSDAGEYSKSDYGSGVSDLNSDDIESVSVLKGPNAAALYGARAANGVVLITSKKGKLNKGLGVSYSGNYTFESPMQLPEFQNVYGQGTQGNTPTSLSELRSSGGSWGAKMDGSNKIYWDGTTKAYSPQPDNVKDFFRTGSTYIHSMAMEAGDSKSSFRFSYTNTSADAIVPGTKLSRHNFNLRATTDLSDKLNVDAKVTYFVQDGTNRPIMGTEGVMAYLYPIPRNTVITDLKDFQDPATYKVKSYANGSVGNPYWFMLHDKNLDSRSRIQGFVKATYTFSEELSAFVRVGTDMANEKIENTRQYGHWFYGGGRLNNSMEKTSETNADALVMYKKTLNDKISFDVNVGANHMYNTYEGMSIFAENFKIPTKPTLESASNNSPRYTPLREKMINSVYGSAQLSYNQVLYLEGSARNDWSSTLPETNWSYFYPSASVSVLVNELIGWDTMNYGKFRVSWAKVGNDTDPYLLQNSFNLSSASDSYLGLTVLTRPSTRNNPDLKPEQVTSFEVGGEFRFFNNRLYTDISYYDRKSKNLIMNIPIPPSTGYSLEHTNVGEMQNTGFEMMLGFIPISKPDFKWDVSFNFSTNKNKLNKLIEGVDRYVLTTTNSGAVEVVAEVGGGYGDIYASTYKLDSQGRKIVDAQGRFIVSPDKKKVGNYQPDWIGGISNTITYKDFSLRFLVDARIGGKVYSGTDAGLDNSGVSKKTLGYREEGIVIDGVKEDGTKNATAISAQEYWGSYAGVAENYVFDQTNIRLRELSFIYEVPKSILGKSFIKGASVGVTGRNIFFIYKALDNFDPEGSFSASNFAQGVLFYNMPTSRSLGFNVNVKF